VAKVIIFGLQDYAELAHYYLENDSPYKVVAFCVNKAYVPEGGQFRGLPVLAFEDVVQTHPAQDFCFFAPMSPKNMNRDRERVFNEIRAKGYRMISYVSSRATLFDNEIGEKLLQFLKTTRCNPSLASATTWCSGAATIWAITATSTTMSPSPPMWSCRGIATLAPIASWASIPPCATASG